MCKKKTKRNKKWNWIIGTLIGKPLKRHESKQMTNSNEIENEHDADWSKRWCESRLFNLFEKICFYGKSMEEVEKRKESKRRAPQPATEEAIADAKNRLSRLRTETVWWQQSTNEIVRTKQWRKVWALYKSRIWTGRAAKTRPKRKAGRADKVRKIRQNRDTGQSQSGSLRRVRSARTWPKRESARAL